MIEVLATCLAVAVGVPWATLAAVAAAWTHPIPTLALVAAAVVVDSHRRAQAPGLWLAVASELRAGASLRSALGLAAIHQGCAGAARLARAGADIERVGEELASCLGADSAGFRAVLAVAAATGAPSAAAFERLEAAEIARAHLRREKRIAMAPAVAQAVVVGGIPAVAAIGSVVAGGPEAGGAFARLVSGVGLALIVAGVVLMGWLTRRAVR